MVYKKSVHKKSLHKKTVDKKSDQRKPDPGKSDIESVETAWRNHQRQLLQYIKSRVNNSHDAEDVLASVFEKLITQHKNQKIPDKPVAWLYAVTRNSIIDFYRERKFDSLPDILEEELPGNHTLSELSKCIVPMVKVLPEKYRQAVMLSDIEGQKHKDVADTLGITLSAVKSRVLRGREKLRESLVNCCVIYSKNNAERISYDVDIDECCGDKE